MAHVAESPGLLELVSQTSVQGTGGQGEGLPDPQCPVVFTRRPLSQRDTEDMFKALTRGAGQPVTAGRRVSAAVWFIITTIGNCTGGQLGTALETRELNSTREKQWTLEIQSQLGMTSRGGPGVVLGPGIPGLGSWALNQELQAHVRYEPGGARRSGWIQEQRAVQQDQQGPSATQEGPGRLPFRASGGRRRRSRSPGRRVRCVRSRPVREESAPGQLARSVGQSLCGHITPLLRSKPAAVELGLDSSVSLRSKQGPRESTLLCGVPRGGSPQAFGSRHLPARVLGPGLRWAHLECEVSPGVGRTPRGQARGQRRAGRRRRHRCPLDCVARRHLRLGPCSLWACPP